MGRNGFQTSGENWLLWTLLFLGSGIGWRILLTRRREVNEILSCFLLIWFYTDQLQLFLLDLGGSRWRVRWMGEYWIDLAGLVAVHSQTCLLLDRLWGTCGDVWRQDGGEGGQTLKILSIWTVPTEKGRHSEPSCALQIKLDCIHIFNLTCLQLKRVICRRRWEAILHTSLAVGTHDCCALVAGDLSYFVPSSCSLHVKING